MASTALKLFGGAQCAAASDICPDLEKFCRSDSPASRSAENAIAKKIKRLRRAAGADAYATKMLPTDLDMHQQPSTTMKWGGRLNKPLL